MTSQELENRIKELELELSILKSTKVESSLLEQGLSFYNVFLSIPTATTLSRVSNGNFVEVNDNFLKITGYKRNEVIGRNSSELGINIEFKRRNEILLQLSLGEQVPDFEIEITSKTGEKRIGLSSIKMIDFSGEQLVCCSFIDITEHVKTEKALKESEEKFKSIFEKSISSIAIADDRGKYLAVNKATSELFEYTVNELMHMNVGDIITANNTDTEAKYEEYLLKGEETGEFDFVSKNGMHKVAQYQAVHIKPDFNLSIMMDITEQKRISEELKIAKLHAEAATREAEEAKQHAENAMNSKQRFLSNMSHEIRTPLNSIMGFTKILLKTDLNDKQKEFLLAIKTSSDALIVLINDILDLAKVDAGKIVFEKRVFNLEESITAILHLFEPKILEKNLKLVKVYDKQIPGTLTGDSARLHQILLNLLSNAVKFTTKGSITVSADLLHEDNEKVTIEFAVKDTGIGIQKNNIDTIFNNFEQASSLTSRVYGGTGLGLAISKQLIELQGGSISVQSEVEKGSTFSFILNFGTTIEINKIESTNTESVPGSTNLKILVVEDMLLNQLLLKTILNNFGFECDLAVNGIVAIDKLKSSTYNIILMDLMMPEMNGFEATEYIRNKMDSKIPIIALTADVTTVDMEKCKALGMNDYISKPIDEKLLFNKIVTLLK